MDRKWIWFLLMMSFSLLLLPASPMAKDKRTLSVAKGPEGPNICLKISTNSWRKTKDFDIVKYLSDKLAADGFRVFIGESRDCPFSLEGDYSEVEGKPFKRENRKNRLYYATNIELSLSLSRGEEKLWSRQFHEVSIETNVAFMFCPPWCSEKDFQREAVRMLKGELEIEYVADLVRIKIETPHGTEIEIISLGLKHKNPDVVESAGRAAYAMGPEPALLEPLFNAFLRANLQDSNLWVAKSIGRYQDDQIINRIVTILEQNKSENVQARAAWVLGCKKTSKMAPALLKIVKTGPVLACLEAVDALIRIDDKKFSEDLKATEKRSSCDYYIRQTFSENSFYTPMSPCE